MRIAAIHWQVWLGAAGAAILVAAGSALYLRRRRPHDPEDAERRRRSYLNSVGRIVEGQIQEIIERPALLPAAARRGMLHRGRSGADHGGNGARKLVCYSYSISGVTYETAQDVTGMEGMVGLDRLAAGQTASVKYDPSDPSNSILVAEDWSGLH